MRTAEDVLRSLKVMTWLALGEGSDWDVRIASEEGMQERPVAQVTATTSVAEAGGPWHRADDVQSFAIYAYPRRAESAEHGLIAALRVAEQLKLAFQLGQVAPARRLRMPLWDFAGVPVEEVSFARRYPDFARVLDFSADTEQSTADERLYTVIAEMRLQWSRNALPPETGPLETIRINVNLGASDV